MELTEQIAKVCHEANKAYSEALGDTSHKTWDTSPIWVRASAIHGVEHVLANPNVTPESMHEAWVAERLSAGWKHGPIKAPDLQEHPCLVPWGDLPEEQRLKDVLFVSVVRALSGAMHVHASGTVINAALPAPEALFDETIKAIDAAAPVAEKKKRKGA